MFTGIVTHRVELLEVVPGAEDVRMRFQAPTGALDGCREGDSIAVSGICLTALRPTDREFRADLTTETLARTTAGTWRPGRLLHFERAMSVAGRFDGHLVSGHVDDTATLLRRTDTGRAVSLEFEVAKRLSRYLAPKGSVCLDGVSLTINEAGTDRFSVCIIPHTLEVTGFGELETGALVNLEVDLVARYVARLLADGVEAP